MASKPNPKEPTGRFNFVGGWSATEQIAFKNLEYASHEVFEFIADNKDAINSMSFDDAVAKGWAEKNPKSFFGWQQIQAMARVFDAFMALADS